MNLEFNFTSILDTAGVLQGLLLGILLLILNWVRRKKTFYLGVFLILYALQRIPHILAEVNAFETYPELFLMPITFLWFLYPLFFIYTQEISILEDEKTKYWLLYPGFLFYIFQIYIYFLPFETKVEIAEKAWFSASFFVGISYGWCIAIWNLKLISNHKIEVNNQFSMTRKRELRWARTFLIVSVIGSMIYLFQHFLLDKNIYSRIFFLIFDLLIIYWVSFHGVAQLSVNSLLSKKAMLETLPEDLNAQHSIVPNSDKNYAEIMEKIDSYMTTSEVFTKSDLSIIELANELNKHPKLISTTINSVRNQNFNTYVNHFRINKAIGMLKSYDSSNLSIEGIGKEVGFHSKSSFYKAFKKVTGVTPAEYKNKEVA